MVGIFNPAVFNPAVFNPGAGSQQQPVGGPALPARYIRPRRKGEKSEAELRAEHYAQLYADLEREAAKEAGLTDSPEKPAAEPQDGHERAAGIDAAPAPSGSLAGLGSALLDKLLALPADEIRIPVEPFPRILSKGRAAAIEAARLHALRIKDDEEAVAALLLTSLF